MSPVQQLHDWCVKHGYDYGYDTRRALFIVNKRFLTVVIPDRQLHDAAGAVEALLYALIDEQRRPCDAHLLEDGSERWAMTSKRG